MPFTQVRDLRMYYELHGAGPRLLSISGSGGDLRRRPNVVAPLRDTFTRSSTTSAAWAGRRSPIRRTRCRTTPTTPRRCSTCWAGSAVT